MLQTCNFLKKFIFIIMKTCSKCKQDKDLNMFWNRITNSDGKRTQCIECERQYNNNKPKVILKKIIKNKTKKVCIKCNIEKDLELFYKRDSIDGRRNNCIECHRKKSKNYRIKNNEVIKQNNKCYYEKNKKELNKKAIEKRKNDPILWLKHKLSSSIRRSIKRKKFNKTSKSAEILGCSIPFFKEYLESQFEHWMNWNNYGEYKPDKKRTWNLDHKIPTDSANNIEELNKLNHYTNFRPLDSYENRMKSNSILEISMDSLL